MQINNLSAEKKEIILKDLWLLHDSRWFIKVIEECGFELANKLNLKVNRSMGKTEMKRFIKEVNFREFDDPEKVKDLFNKAVELFLPKDHEYKFEVYDRNTITGRVDKCIIYPQLEKGGTAAIYECPGKQRCDGWLEACGIKGESFSNKTAQTCKGKCEITFKLNHTLL